MQWGPHARMQLHEHMNHVTRKPSAVAPQNNVYLILILDNEWKGMVDTKSDWPANYTTIVQNA